MTQGSKKMMKHTLKETITSLYTAFSLPQILSEPFTEAAPDMYHTLQRNNSGILLYNYIIVLLCYIKYLQHCAKVLKYIFHKGQ